jgi:hypothetical protein
MYGFLPVRLHQDAGHDVTHVKRCREQKDALDLLIIRLQDQEPDAGGGKRHRDVLADVQQRQRTRDAREIRHHVGHVGQNQSEQDEERRAQAELFPDQVRQPLARHRTHSRAHLLRHDQQQRDRQQRPKRQVTVLRARLRIGEDASSVVVHHSRDEPRPDDGEENSNVIARPLQHPTGASARRSHRPRL